jgi:predicted DNA-binding protein (MmcQ/YjbR family)
MNVEAIRDFCLSLPSVTEKVQWGNDLVFKVGEKMFAVLCLVEEGEVKLSFKCTPEEQAELVEQDGIIPAPYLARYHWVGLKRFDALNQTDLKRLIGNSYKLERVKLPAKVQARLDEAPAKRKRKQTAL